MKNKDNLICGCRVISCSFSSYRNEEGDLVHTEPVLEVENVQMNHSFTITFEGFCSLAGISKTEAIAKIFPIRK